MLIDQLLEAKREKYRNILRRCSWNRENAKVVMTRDHEIKRFHRHVKPDDKFWNWYQRRKQVLYDIGLFVRKDRRGIFTVYWFDDCNLKLQPHQVMQLQQEMEEWIKEHE